MYEEWELFILSTLLLEVFNITQKYCSHINLFLYIFLATRKTKKHKLKRYKLSKFSRKRIIKSCKQTDSEENIKLLYYTQQSY